MSHFARVPLCDKCKKKKVPKSYYNNFSFLFIAYILVTVLQNILKEPAKSAYSCPYNPAQGFTALDKIEFKYYYLHSR